MFLLILLGSLVGLLSGFFGIGGGTILVPMLLLLGYNTKVAIGISVVVMVFSSIYGSYVNNKKGTLDVVMVMTIGLGGFIGAMFSGVITAYASEKVLEFIFLLFSVFALLRMFFSPSEHLQERENTNRIILFAVGFAIGIVSMTIGVGGSLILVPILVGFFHIPLKRATSAGLFFVTFSSVSGLISHSIEGGVDYTSGTVIGLASLGGVYLGIHLKDKVSTKTQKLLLTLFYLSIVCYIGFRLVA